MKIVIIGGTGHVGTYLVPRLVEAGHEVICISRGESTPYLPHPAWESVERVIVDRYAEEQGGTFGKRIRDLGADVVIDMICFTLDSCQHLVDALRGNVQHFLHCGTIWIHGHSVQVPITEDQPRSPFGEYGIQKSQIEMYLMNEARRNGFPATALHPGHIVGPGHPPVNPAGNKNIAVFQKLARGEELALPNLGMETLHHVHADDVAQSFMAAMTHWSVAVGESFHVVSPAALTLRGFAEAVAGWFNQPANLKFMPWEAWRQTVSEGDATATWDHIAHSPNVSMQRGITENDVQEMRASFYKEPQHEGRVVCVLGAGNIAAIPAMDVLTKMFNEGKVCLLKMNPVNAYLGQYLEKAFRAAIDEGFLKIIYGGVEEAKYSTNHTLVDEIHITGSDKTYDAIVWGQDPQEQSRNKLADNRANTRPVTAELGNVSPVMLVPGPYQDRQLKAQAEMLVADLTMNASFLCCSAKVLLLPKNWEGSSIFLNHVRELLTKIPSRKAYYPGAFSRWEKFRKTRTDFETIGQKDASHLPWTIFDNIDIDGDPVCREEPFCSIISIAYVGDSDPENFLNEAVTVANDKLWGNLVATLIVHPKVQKAKTPKPFFDMAVRKLRYGTISINAFNGMSFVFGSTPWGAYPGMEANDIQSGRGFVHNTMMLEGIEKCVMNWPLTMFPKPGYYPTHKRSHRLLRKLIRLEARQSPLKLPGVISEAIIGSM